MENKMMMEIIRRKKWVCLFSRAEHGLLLPVPTPLLTPPCSAPTTTLTPVMHWMRTPNLPCSSPRGLWGFVANKQ